MNQLIQFLQISLAPVTLISGVGLLLLSMTNRFARTTDRARVLVKDTRDDSDFERKQAAVQIKILYRRSRILLVSISLALSSIFLVSTLIVSLFASAIFNLDLHLWGGALFALSLGALLLSLSLFIYDMTLSLSALRLELKDYL
ncbi:MAG TPA: DUF2721 domain-containing protein [Anaerolineales bacterium]|nr:DUF2721 domain-containing protein [Anaerolineales bacterium]